MIFIAKNSTYKLGLFLIAILTLWYINIKIPIENNINTDVYRARQITILYLGIIIFSVITIIRKKNVISLKDIIIGLVLGGLSGLASHNAILIGFGTCFAYISSIAMYSDYERKVFLFRKPIKKHIVKDLIWIISLGSVLGFINILSFLKSDDIILKINMNAFLTALVPGISEEVIFRLFLFAMILRIIGGDLNSKADKFLCSIILLYPFALMHYPDQAVAMGISSILYSSIMLSLFFGLPLMLLFFKRDLFTAIGVHIMIDFIRFSLFAS